MARIYFDYNRTQLELIRSLIAQPNMIAKVSQNISREDFKISKYQAVYSVIFDLFSEEREINEASVSSLLLDNEGIELTEEDIYAFFNTDTLVQPPTELAKMLKSHSIKDKTNNLTENFKKEINTPGTKLLDELGLMQTALEDLSTELTPKDKVTFKDQMDDFLETVTSEEEQEGIPSMYKTLDKYTKGWLPEQLITVAARTSVGKSVVAVNCALSAALCNKRTLFFSLEMGSSELISRLIACKSFIKLNNIYPKLKVEGEEKKKFLKTYEEIKELPIIIDDTAEVSLNYIKSKAIETSKSEGGLDFIIVDYIQLITSNRSHGQSRQEQISEISRGLKILAKQLQVPVMIVAQLNRGDKDDEDRIPGLADIRESAAIAQDSDIVLILHRKYRDTSDDPKALFILDKNRNGPAGKQMRMRCMLDKALFQDIKKDDKDEVQDTEEKSQEIMDSLEQSIKLENKEEEEDDSFVDIDDLDDLFDDIE